MLKSHTIVSRKVFLGIYSIEVKLGRMPDETERDVLETYPLTETSESEMPPTGQGRPLKCR